MTPNLWLLRCVWFLCGASVMALVSIALCRISTRADKRRSA